MGKDSSNSFVKGPVFDSSPLIKSFVSGMVSGSLSTVLLQPLDLVKTRLQKQTNLGSRHGMFAELSNIIKQEKVTSLWNGLIPSLCRTVPGVGLYFTTIHWLKSTFGSEKPSNLESMVIGASSRCFSGFMVLPFTVMKTRYESGEFHYRHIRHAIQSTYAKEGIKGLYSGLTPTLLRDVPYAGLYLVFYTRLKEFTADVPTQYFVLTTFCNGGLAACMSSLITQPVDVIKTNVQLYTGKFGSTRDVVKHIYNKNGLKGFQRGLLPRIIRRALMSAISWSVYEEMMRIYKIKT